MDTEFKAVIDLLSMLILDPRTGLLIGLLLGAAWMDWRTGRIPNRLVLVGTALGLASNMMVEPTGAGGIVPAGLWALSGAACGLALMLPFYLLRVMGAGDVKLMAMTGAFLGMPGALWAVLSTFLAGGALALAYLAWKGELRRVLLDLGRITGNAPATRSGASAGTLPYGLAIAGGTIGYLVLHQLGLVK